MKLFRTTVANANTERLKSFHTLFDTYMDYMLAKSEPNRQVRNVQKLSFWTKNRVILKLIFYEALTPFCKLFLWLKQLFDVKILIFRLPFFCVPNIMVIQHV